jgi:ribonuclease VapC
VILDTSALMAILAAEEDAPRYAEAIHAARGRCVISAATLVELTMVAEGRGDATMPQRVEALLRHIDARVIAVDERQAHRARDGWRRYGKGRHPAKLNLGDCFSYALARERDETLLFKGEDFAQTDVRKAL